jgi:hypothetical protein
LKYKNKKSKVIKIGITQNYHDQFLIVINDLTAFPHISQYLQTIDDTTLLQELEKNSTIDSSRGNARIDFGYACGQNLERDVENYGATKPRLLDRTRDPVFIVIQKHLSVLIDMTSDIFKLPYYHRVDDIHRRYSNVIQDGGLFPAWRVAWNSPQSFLEVHEDNLNDPRPLMSPVGVLSKMYDTPN